MVRFGRLLMVWFGLLLMVRFGLLLKVWFGLMMMVQFGLLIKVRFSVLLKFWFGLLLLLRFSLLLKVRFGLLLMVRFGLLLKVRFDLPLIVRFNLLLKVQFDHSVNHIRFGHSANMVLFGFATHSFLRQKVPTLCPFSMHSWNLPSQGKSTSYYIYITLYTHKDDYALTLSTYSSHLHTLGFPSLKGSDHRFVYILTWSSGESNYYRLWA